MGSVRVQIKPYKLKELRVMYGMDDNPKAFKRMLDRYKDDIGEPDGQFFDVLQVIKIFKRCGVPGIYLSDELEITPQEKNKAA